MRFLIGKKRKKVVVECPFCDVTWKGRPGDPCWSCASTASTFAKPVQIKIVAEASAEAVPFTQTPSVSEPSETLAVERSRLSA